MSPLSRRLRPQAALTAGVRFASRTVLQAAVVLLGFQLSLGQIASVGVSSLPTMLGTLAICLATASYVGRWLGLDGDLKTLIGAGTAICGASAIAAVSPVIRAKSNHIAYAVSTIFFFNIVAVLAFPPLGHLLGMSQEAFGLFAGTAVNDTSSVVAAAATYGHEAADHAVVVKLTRSLMIIPICVGLSVLVARRDRAVAGADAAAEHQGILHLIPWFLIGFILAAAVNSTGLVPDLAHAGTAPQCGLHDDDGADRDRSQLRRAGSAPRGSAAAAARRDPVAHRDVLQPPDPVRDKIGQCCRPGCPT